MKSPAARPALSVRSGSEVQLPGTALVGLMRAVLARGLPFRFRARGWSMSPFIRDRDVITIVPVDSTSLKIGDIVAFAGPDGQRLVVHRVVGRRGTDLRIQGDSAARAADDLVPESSVLGRVKRVERNGQQVWFGLGTERLVVAFLSRKRVLSLLVMKVRALVRRLGRGKAK
ncbi:MAG: S24/S26 family peptidase [candidate division WOR-3 bacterium]|nr:MAG: S24/S26 family peptidase [candidate division WOR-3 bacterium]